MKGFHAVPAIVLPQRAVFSAWANYSRRRSRARVLLWRVLDRWRKRRLAQGFCTISAEAHRDLVLNRLFIRLEPSLPQLRRGESAEKRVQGLLFYVVAGVRCADDALEIKVVSLTLALVIAL